MSTVSFTNDFCCKDQLNVLFFFIHLFTQPTYRNWRVYSLCPIFVRVCIEKDAYHCTNCLKNHLEISAEVLF